MEVDGYPTFFKPPKTSKNKKGTSSLPKQKNPLKRSKIARSPKSERSRATKEADRVFSLYIRQRGSNGTHNFCFTCGVYLEIGSLQCGHFMKRGFFNTRWHELNCWPQCNDCNVEKRGNLVVYRKILVSKYGELAVEGLEDLALAPSEISTPDIKEITKKYKPLVF